MPQQNAVAQTVAACPRRPAPRRRAPLGGVAAAGLLVLLSACAQQPQTAGQATARHASYARPSSYDPPGPPGDPWGPYVQEASRRFDVPERWIREVMRQESGGRVSATSPVGAMGLMQVMPGTYRELRARYDLGDDPYHPFDSLMAGAAYIREMYDLYGAPAFLAAYNAGPRRLESYLWGGGTLPAETRNYVGRIGPRIVGAEPTRRAPPEVYAAAEMGTYVPPGRRPVDSATMLALREQRNATQPGIQVAQLPPGPVTRMEPIPDGSTYAYTPPSAPVPVQIASAEPGLPAGAVVRMEPIPDGSTAPGRARLAEAAGGEVVRMEPIPDGSTTQGRPRPAEATRTEPLPLPPAAAPRPAAPQQFAALQAPPAPRGGPGFVLVPPGYAAAAGNRAPTPARGGFGLLGSAQASTLPVPPAAPLLRQAAAAPQASRWAVQVGAYASEAQARNAALGALNATPASNARAMVEQVTRGRERLFRARVVGLSQGGAQSACDRLRSRGACNVLSPDAQD